MSLLAAGCALSLFAAGARAQDGDVVAGDEPVAEEPAPESGSEAESVPESEAESEAESGTVVGNLRLADPEIARVTSNEAYLRERGRHCAGRGRSQWVISQLLAAQHNPDGALNLLRVGACIPLNTTPGVLNDYTNLEFGIVNELSPSFVRGGGYAQITPLSFLQFRISASALVYWPLPTNRTGYNPVDGYDSRYDPAALPQGVGYVAGGWNADFIGIFRAKVPFNETWALLVVNIFNLSYFDIGDADYYLNLRWDVILQQQDWMFNNEAMLGIEARINSDFGVRLGLYDSFRHVFESGYDGHQVGIFAMGWWPNPSDAVWDLTPFVRAGTYIDHAFRAETFSVTGGVMTQYRLGDM